MSTVIGTYNLGTVARYNLLKKDQLTTVDRKLDIEYREDDHSAFKRTLFSHELHQGLCFERWEGQEHFSVSLSKLSVPVALKTRLNLWLALSHIPADQELHRVFYGVELAHGLRRITDKALHTVAVSYLQASWHHFVEGYKAGESVRTTYQGQELVSVQRSEVLRGLSIC